MENKYYPPEIEDLVIGLTFEIDRPLLVGSLLPNGTWHPFTIDADYYLPRHDETTDLSELISAIPKGNIRVKHLNRDCIEELGWQHDYNMEPIPNREVNPTFEGYLFEKNGGDDQWCLYHFDDHEVWVEYIHNCAGKGYVFKGFIKNKSELKILMQWLSITN